MGETITQFLSWAAPIASTLIIAALTAQIKARQDAAETDYEYFIVYSE